MHHVGALGHGNDLVDELGGIGDADGVADVEMLGRGVGVLVGGVGVGGSKGTYRHCFLGRGGGWCRFGALEVSWSLYVSVSSSWALDNLFMQGRAVIVHIMARFQ